MNCKSLFFLVVFSLTLISGVFAQKKVSILGDSYSTFYGHVSPAANLCWYGVPGEKKENDVTKVEETWWYRFIHEHGFQLERNNSYSGSTVCHTGYEKADYSDRSFITRIHNLGTPDIILVFGGTNDSWAGAPIGVYQYDGWTKADLYSFRPAFCYLLASLKQLYPAARIYNITNSELSEARARFAKIVNPAWAHQSPLVGRLSTSYTSSPFAILANTSSSFILSI